MGEVLIKWYLSRDPSFEEGKKRHIKLIFSMWGMGWGQEFIFYAIQTSGYSKALYTFPKASGQISSFCRRAGGGIKSVSSGP